MEHQSLYRKYRPQRFGELVGQDHVVNALRAAVRDGRVGHAYLFSGPRGTGKTTTARILAKALNCTDLSAQGEPCGVCANCVAIAAGTFFDLFELDAASNRGIENIKDVTESVALGIGPGSRKKVYVLDEVHMLTDPASNALLKTLEEPPNHVVFVLATTNPEKVLPTIRSRTQHFAFTLVSHEELVGRLADLCAREGVDADPEALAVIATAGAGSVRDSESMLDQALAQGTGRLDATAVAMLFGGTAFASRVRVLEAIANEDAASALVALAELLDSGHEPRRVAEDLLGAARAAFLVSAADGRVEVEAPEDEQFRLRELGAALGNAALVRVIETIGQAVTDMRGVDTADPRLVLEVALVRLSRREAGPALQTIVERIERLERQLGSSPPVVDARPTPAARPATRPAPAPADEAPAAGPASAEETVSDVSAAPSEAASARASRPTLGALRRTAAQSGDAPSASSSGPVPAPAPVPPAAEARDSEPTGVVDLDDVILEWGKIVPVLSPATRSAVQHAQPLRIDGDVLVFGVPPKMLGAARDRFRREADNVRDALAARLGRRFKFNVEAAPEFALDDDGSSASGSPTERAEDEPPPDVVDPSEVTDVVPDADPPSVSRLRDELGATVVDEIPRDG